MSINNNLQTSLNRMDSISNTSNKVRVQPNIKATRHVDNVLKTHVSGNKVDKSANSGIKTEPKENIEKFKQVVESMDNFIKSTNTSIHFVLHEKLGEYYAQIIDSETEEVIKEIPSQEIMDTYAKMLESIGIIVDKKI